MLFETEPVFLTKVVGCREPHNPADANAVRVGTNKEPDAVVISP